MRRLILTAALAACASAPAAAQTPYGSLRGSVQPTSERRADYTGVRYWTDAEVKRGVTARVTLTPLWTYGCRTGLCAPDTLATRGISGSFDAGQVYMGRYRIRATAAGCTPWEAEIVVTQHQEAVLNIPLRCPAVAKAEGG